MADDSLTGRRGIASPGLSHAPQIDAPPRRPVQSRPLRPLYGTRELTMDIRRLRSGWKRYRKARQRGAIFEWLQVVLEVVTIWRSDGHANGRTRRAMARRGCKIPKVIEPCRDLIVAVSHRAKLDRRTVAKWSRFLKYADAHKPPSVSLSRFARKRNGVNGCAKLYSQRLGRKAKLAKKN